MSEDDIKHLEKIAKSCDSTAEYCSSHKRIEDERQNARAVRDAIAVIKSSPSPVTKPATERDEKPVFSGERCSEIIVKSPPTALLREVVEAMQNVEHGRNHCIDEWDDVNQAELDKLKDICAKLTPYVEGSNP